MASHTLNITETNYIFIISFATSTLVFLFGFILFLAQISLYTDFLGLIALSVGGIQIFADIGWITILKANRFDEIQSWKQAIQLVIKRKGQKIFLFPALFDVVLIVLSTFLIFGI